MASRESPPSIGVHAGDLRSGSLTGVGWYTLQSLRALVRQGDPSGIRVLGALPEAWTLPEEVGVDPVRFGRGPGRIFRDFWGAGRWASRRKLDALHCPRTIVPAGFQGPLSMTVYDVSFLRRPDLYSTASRWYWQGALRWSLRRVRRVVAISRTTADRLIESYSLGADDVTVVPCGVDVDRFSPRRETDETKVLNDFGVEKPYFLYVGHDHPRKNLRCLIEAYERAHRGRSFPTLLLVGPVDENRFEHTGPGSGEPWRGDVRITGYVDREVMPILYRHAAVLVFPSFDEGFGMPLLEALACGCPVICSDIAVFEEVGESLPRYFNPASPRELADRLKEAATGLARPTEEGPRLARRYTWSRVGRRYRALFRELLPSA